MYPKLYTQGGELLAVLDNIVHDTARIKKVLNGEFTFTFEVPEEELKSGYLSDENVVVVDDYQFDIKYVEYIRNHEIRYKVLCEHINYRLGDGDENKVKNWDPEEPKDNYLELGTPTFHLTKILEGTDFTVGEVYDFDLYEEDEEGEPQPTDEITIQASGDTTRREILKDLARIVGGELEFVGDGFTVNLLNIGGVGENHGFEARFGKNLLGVTKFIDRRGGLEVNYTVDIVELKNSKDYIENDLSDLKKINVGDVIRIVDDTIGLNVENRIVSVEYDPINALNTHIEIENQVENIAKYVERIRTTTVQTEREYNNVSISSDYGFRAERNDRKAKIQMNATTGLEVRTRSDVEQPYVTVLYIDTDGNLVMSGIINIIPGSSGLGDLAFEDSIDLFDSEKITSIPNAIKAPSGEGLFISDTHLGYYNNEYTVGWRTYMDQYGNFYLGGSDGALQWDAGKNELKIEGTILMTGGSVSWEYVTDKPEIPDPGEVDLPDWVQETYIDGGTVETPLAIANFLRIVDTIFIGSTDESDNVMGLSGEDPDNPEAVRIWAGSADKNTAPFRLTHNGHVTITGENAETVIDEFGINPKFLDYSKNLVWNSSFEVRNSDDKPFYWNIIGDGNSSGNSSFWGERSLRLGPGGLARQHLSAGINPDWINRQVVRVSMYANFEQDFKVRIVDVGSWAESSGTLIRYYKLDETEETELTFTGSNGWEDSRISFTFDSDEFEGASTRFAIEIENVDSGDIYIDAVMMHPDFTGSWSQLYKHGPRSLSFESIGDAWGDTEEFGSEPEFIGGTGGSGDCNLHIGDEPPEDEGKLWWKP